MKKSTYDVQQQHVSSPQIASVQQIVAQGVIQNLPEIIGAMKEIYTTHKKGQIFQHVLQSRLEGLHVTQSNFTVLVSGLTELSKTENADPETKEMYRNMIKALFDIFVTNMKDTQNIDKYLSKL